MITHKNSIILSMLFVFGLLSISKVYSVPPDGIGIVKNMFSMNLETSCSVKNIGSKSAIHVTKIGDQADIVSGITFTKGSTSPLIDIRSIAQVGLGFYTDSQGVMHPSLSIGNPNDQGTFCVALNRTKVLQLMNPFSFLYKMKTKKTQNVPFPVQQDMLSLLPKFVPDSKLASTVQAIQSAHRSIADAAQTVVQTLADMPLPNTFSTNGFLQYKIGGRMLATCYVGNFGEESEVSLIRAGKEESITPGITFTRGDSPLVSLSSIVEAGIGTYRDQKSGRIYPSFSVRNTDNTGAVCLGINTEKLLSFSNWNTFLTNKYMPQGTVVELPEPSISAGAGGE